ncbi:MAG: NAD(P)/FAD-dependent oxidoreductase [Chloroflexi bacterium]|nr:NAD(P)/FAD-dependent oxidoreductase [Chloroflexota bacterium]
MKTDYDVIVVGAGPAGSVAARRAALAGLRVLLIEKRREIGAPVRCAEAIGIPSTMPYITVEPCWVDAEVDSFAIVNALGDAVVVPATEPTAVVNRKVFDFELACLAMEAGADVVTGVAATGLILNEGAVAGVKVLHFGHEHSVVARLVVAADGTESQVARWAGLNTVPPLNDYYTCAQYLLGGIDLRFSARVCEYHLGPELAPGGYAWVFPKGKHRANVGIAMTAGKVAKTASPQEYLDQFVSRHFPDASQLSVVTGGIPITGALKRMVGDGLMVVGDAAHQADPLTAGGINLGMIGADLAMQVAVPALAAGDVSAARLSEYERLWSRQFAQQHGALLRIRKILTDLPPNVLADLICKASVLPIERMSHTELLTALLIGHPRLLLEVLTLAATQLILK